MIVYGRRTYRLRPRSFLAGIRRRLEALPTSPSRDAIVDLLVGFGEAYAAIADALQPRRDGECAALAPWSDAMQRLADALCRYRIGRGESVSASLARVLAAIAALEDRKSTR